MPLLGANAPLPRQPRRVLVAGASGSGKTTLARHIASRLDLPHIEIDALFHGPGWTPRPEFAAEVDAFSRGERWVTEWQYGSVRDLLADRADLFVWLDLPRTLVLRRVTRRTVRRRLRREVLWNGNVEPPLRTFLTDPEHVIRWSWSTQPHVAPRIGALLDRRPELVLVRLADTLAVERWAAGPLQDAGSATAERTGPPAAPGRRRPPTTGR